MKNIFALFLSIDVAIRVGYAWVLPQSGDFNPFGIRILPGASDPKSVNLELETSLFIQPNEQDRYLNYIKSLRIFLDKVERAIMSTRQSTRGDEDYNVFEVFTDRLKQVLQKYDDAELENMSKALKAEVHEWMQDPVIDQILYDPRLKEYIKKYVDNVSYRRLKDNSVFKTRDGESEMWHHMWEAIKKFYTNEDSKVLMNVLSRLDEGKHSRTHLRSALHDLFKDLVVEKYEKLNYTQKNELAKAIHAIGDELGLKTGVNRVYIKDRLKELFQSFKRDDRMTTTTEKLRLYKANSNIKHYELANLLKFYRSKDSIKKMIQKYHNVV